jgi:DNA polymerase III subunit delta
MIVKSFELKKLNTNKKNIYLLYGENEGFKNEVIKKYFEVNFSDKIYKYDQNEILINKESFYNNVLTKSFFENEKLIIISRADDKIKDIIQEILEKKLENIIIILNANLLDKKSKIRSFFERNKDAICIPFYADTNETLSSITSNFFKKKKISISQQTINMLVERTRGDRKNLENELQKIESFIQNKKKITPEEISKLTNLAENYDISELADNCLAKNSKRTINILNENNFSIEDCIMIIRTILIKTKRLNKINISLSKNNTSVDEAISSFKPPIFWKDKEILKQQIKNWSHNNIEGLIYKINEIELIIKKNSNSSINILSDFIIGVSAKTNN